MFIVNHVAEDIRPRWGRTVADITIFYKHVIPSGLIELNEYHFKILLKKQDY